MGTPVNELPYADFKKHTVYVLSPGPMGCTCCGLNIQSCSRTHHLYVDDVAGGGSYDDDDKMQLFLVCIERTDSCGYKYHYSGTPPAYITF